MSAELICCHMRPDPDVPVMSSKRQGQKAPSLLQCHSNVGVRPGHTASPSTGYGETAQSFEVGSGPWVVLSPWRRGNWAHSHWAAHASSLCLSRERKMGKGGEPSPMPLRVVHLLSASLTAESQWKGPTASTRPLEHDPMWLGDHISHIELMLHSGIIFFNPIPLQYPFFHFHFRKS